MNRGTSSRLDDSQWELVWADEFDGDGRPDPSNWTYELGFVRNDELQWYRPENAWLQDGLLMIEGRREQLPNPAFDPTSDDWRLNRPYAEYTSASLTTRGLHHWQYGRFEMRARIDTREGLWPAFWTLGVEGEWPSNGEIDIMEFYQGKLLANVAWGSDQRWVARWASVVKSISESDDPDWSNQFHVWRMDWDEDWIRLYVDEELLNEVDLRKTYNEGRVKSNPFHQPHYIIVNLAIGGRSGGDPSRTEFPARLEVDYIRVYRRIR